MTKSAAFSAWRKSSASSNPGVPWGNSEKTVGQLQHGLRRPPVDGRGASRCFTSPQGLAEVFRVGGTPARRCPGAPPSPPSRGRTPPPPLGLAKELDVFEPGHDVFEPGHAKCCSPVQHCSLRLDAPPATFVDFSNIPRPQLSQIKKLSRKSAQRQCVDECLDCTCARRTCHASSHSSWAAGCMPSAMPPIGNGAFGG